ncbi:MAG: hypothetical protein WBW88_10770, partial [Rhodothermales bacterium]
FWVDEQYTFQTTEKEAAMNTRIDWLTVAAISVVAYVLQNVLHEAVGHGGMCLLLGGDPSALSTAYFDMVDGSVSPAGRKLVAAGGTIVNLLAGGLFWVALRATPTSRSSVRFFIWLSMTINLLTGTGYFLFSGVSQVGDWVVVISGFEPHWFWTAALIVVGLSTYLLSIWLALKTLNPLLGADDTLRLKRAFDLSFKPYLAGCIATTVGAALNPVSPTLILMSAAANFGGTSGLAWMTQLYNRPWFTPSTGPPIEIGRSWSWIIAGSVLLALHILVLGPSVTF